jgi:hypothetical protein
VKFWDSSALVPLVVDETSSSWARALLRNDRQAVIWSLSPVEIRSALARRRRDGALTSSVFSDAKLRTQRLCSGLTQVVAFEIVRDRALRILDLHGLRASDALQLAAALVACDERPASLHVVTLDLRLADAAEREGFPVDTLRG